MTDIKKLSVTYLLTIGQLEEHSLNMFRAAVCHILTVNCETFTLSDIHHNYSIWSGISKLTPYQEKGCYPLLKGLFRKKLFVANGSKWKTSSIRLGLNISDAELAIQVAVGRVDKITFKQDGRLVEMTKPTEQVPVEVAETKKTHPTPSQYQDSREVCTVETEEIHDFEETQSTWLEMLNDLWLMSNENSQIVRLPADWWPSTSAFTAVTEDCVANCEYDDQPIVSDWFYNDAVLNNSPTSEHVRKDQEEDVAQYPLIVRMADLAKLRKLFDEYGTKEAVKSEFDELLDEIEARGLLGMKKTSRRKVLTPNRRKVLTNSPINALTQ